MRNRPAPNAGPLTAVLAIWACSACAPGAPSSPDATTGAIRVEVVTSGSEVPDAYQVSVDAGQAHSVASTGNLTFQGILPGQHSVELVSIPFNCAVDGSNPREAAVAEAGTTEVSFSVSCEAAPPGDLAVTTATSGDDLDTGYSVVIDGGTPVAIGANTTLTFEDLDDGNHTVELTNVASNCTVSGSNPRTVNVPAGGTGSTTFDVGCEGLTGDLAVTTATSGVEPDPDGYAVVVDGVVRGSIGTDDIAVFPGLPVGARNVELAALADNCAVQGDNPRTLPIFDGQTTPTTFAVVCAITTGSIEVTVSTSGLIQDPDGYTLDLDGIETLDVDVDDTATFTDVAEGRHIITLADIASNCEVDDDNPVEVDVTAGKAAVVGFDVDCSLF